VELHSIVETARLGGTFYQTAAAGGRTGCGDASFLVEYARRHPDRNFIGVERLLGRIRKLDRKGQRAGLANLRGVQIESSYFLQIHVAAGLGLRVCTFIFPILGRRKGTIKTGSSTNHSATGLAPRSLRAARFICETDDEDYFAQMTGVFGASREFQRIETPPNWRICSRISSGNFTPAASAPCARLIERRHEFQNVNNRAVVFIGFGRALSVLKCDAGAAHARQGIQRDGYDADDKCAEKGKSRKCPLENVAPAARDEVKEQRINDEREESEREKQQRQRDQHQDRADEGH